MKRTVLSIAAGVISTLLIHSPAKAQWVTNGPYGGSSSALINEGGVIYAGAGNRIYKSENDGYFWTETGNKDIHAVSGLVSSGGKLFAGTGNFQGVLVSADNGATWTQKNTGLSYGMIDLMFSNQTGVYAAIDRDLFFTSNGGDSWSEIGAGLGTQPNANINVLRQYGDTLFAGTGGEYGSLYMSTDNGQNFTHVSGFPAQHAVYTLAYEGDNIYAGTWFGVFKSADRGATWTQSDSGMSGGYTRSMIVAHGKIFASTLEGGIFVSSDDGATWTEANNGIMGWREHDDAPYPFADAMVETDAGLVAATNDGIYVSNDAGSSWSRANDEIKANRMQSIAAQGNYVFGGAGRMYVSGNQGSTWNLSHNGIEGSSIIAITVQGSVVLASTGNQELYRSTDNGATWAEAGAGVMGRVDVLASNEQRIVAIVRHTGSANQQLMQSVDGGLTFTDMPGAVVITGMMRALGLFEDRIYVGNDKGMVFRSSDNGATWRDIGNYLPNVEITEIIALAEETYVSTAGKGVFRFTENDYVIESYSDGLPNYHITDLVIEGDFIFASTGGAGVFATKLGFENWFHVSAGLENPFVSHLASANGKVYAATGTGVYQTDEEAFDNFLLMAGIGEKEVDLASVFPNPTKGVLFYQLNEQASLQLLDVNGRVVRSIPDASASGSINMEGLGEGFYILQVQTAQGMQAKKIVVSN